LIAASDAEGRADVARRLQNRGFTTTEAGNVTSALNCAYRNPPDCIFTCIDLQDGDCFPLLRAFANDRPVVAGGFEMKPERILTAFHLGADDVLSLPMDAQEMALRLRKAINRFQRRGAHHVSFGGLRLDPNARAVVNERQMRALLTQSEYDALRLLLSHGGQALTRAQIYEAAVGGQMDEESRAVDMLVSKLRSKLRLLNREIETSPRISAVRGSGYCMAPGKGGGKLQTRGQGCIGSCGAAQPLLIWLHVDAARRQAPSAQTTH
jgi:two-component system OmpR family response regulator